MHGRSKLGRMPKCLIRADALHHTGLPLSAAVRHSPSLPRVTPPEHMNKTSITPRAPTLQVDTACTTRSGVRGHTPQHAARKHRSGVSKSYPSSWYEAGLHMPFKQEGINQKVTGRAAHLALSQDQAAEPLPDARALRRRPRGLLRCCIDQAALLPVVLLHSRRPLQRIVLCGLLEHLQCNLSHWRAASHNRASVYT